VELAGRQPASMESGWAWVGRCVLSPEAEGGARQGGGVPGYLQARPVRIVLADRQPDSMNSGGGGAGLVLPPEEGSFELKLELRHPGPAVAAVCAGDVM
jgi:hypothetical protein